MNKFHARLAWCTLGFALAACANVYHDNGVTALPALTSATKPAHSWMAPGAASGDLLYISDAGYGAVFVYTYSPFGMKFVGILTEPSNPGPICVDREQNVWILPQAGTFSFSATEYAHGGTTPIAILTDPVGTPTGCAINPKDDDLVMGTIPATLAIFRHERGKPVLVSDPSISGFYTCCAYDKSGDLFAYGSQDQQGNFLDELPKGSKSFKRISLHREISFMYGMQWAGKYLTVADSDASPSVVRQYEVTASDSKEVGVTPLNGVTYLWQYYIDGTRIIAPNALFNNFQSGFVGLYHYPLGGKGIRISLFSLPLGVAVSRAPH